MTRSREISLASDLDLYLFGEGRHLRAWEFLGARFGVLDDQEVTVIAVWAPGVRRACVVGDFNGWQRWEHLMTPLGDSGVYEAVIASARPGDCYKFVFETASGEILEKADPFARETEIPPRTASVISDGLEGLDRSASVAYKEAHKDWNGSQPMSIYEVHLGSIDPSWETKTYERCAEYLVDRVVDLGFTHVEFMPLAEHPYGGSWGYQTTSYFAPTSRWGRPKEAAALIEACHRRGVGVILDFVPGHFATDEFGLYRFDGTALYEHLDPRQGIHRDWGTAVFNFSRREVRSFLLSAAMFWIDQMGVDGLRVDAVSSMLYLDYSRDEWIPNEFGGRENLAAISFLKELCEDVPTLARGALVIAEESTAFPAVTKPTYLGGLGFSYKWNMGWMHDTLDYFGRDPVHRRWHHNQLTFGLVYGYSENFILPLSHDEVVHQKGSLYQRMPGDHWQKLANVRALLAWMWAHPGKKLSFMGNEIAQRDEWSDIGSLRSEIHSSPDAAAVEHLVRDLNQTYRSIPALYEGDHRPDGFSWAVHNDSEANVAAFFRYPNSKADDDDIVLVVANFSPVPRFDYGIAVPRPGMWKEMINTDAELYGGSGIGNYGGVSSVVFNEAVDQHGVLLTLPPLGVVYLCR